MANPNLQLLHRVRSMPAAQVFTVYLRYLVGGAFIISTFTLNKFGLYDHLMPTEKPPIQELDPIGQFLRVMSDSGLYWKFIGISQMICGILLATQKFAQLGALIFFTIILNIFLITVGYNFSGTPVITGLMLLAGGYLLLWDYEAFLPMISDQVRYNKQPLLLADQPYWIKLGAVIVLTIILSGIFYPNAYFLLVAPFTAGLIGFIFFVWRKQ